MVNSLRPYQEVSVVALRRALAAGKLAPVLVAPTGSGKTRIAGEIALGARAKGKRVMFVAPRRKLVIQTAASFRKLGMQVGLVMAGHTTRPTAEVLVASMQTLIARFDGGLPEVDLVIVDEAHESTLGAVSRVVGAFREKGVRTIGLTATPARGDGKGLGEVFDEMVFASNVAELTQLGHLVPVKYFAPSEPDLKGVRITAGDYNQKQLGERMAPLIGDVVENWKRIAPGQKTVVFTVTVANAQALCEAFQAAGVPAEWISGNTPEDEQEAIFARHSSGETLVLCNAQLLSFGWDSPEVTCCVLAKPTKSIAAYLQMAGRVLRPADGKTHATLIDHSGVVDRLGFVDDDFGWTLDGKQQAAENKSRTRDAQKPNICPCCKSLHKPAPKCPVCGAEFSGRRSETPEQIAAQLEEVNREKRKLKNEWSQERKDLFYAELRGYARAKGKKDGWAYYAYQERLGVFPTRKTEILEPSQDTKNWIVHRAIKRAKSAEKARATQEAILESLG